MTPVAQSFPAATDSAASFTQGLQLNLWAPGITPAHVQRLESIRAKLFLEGAQNDSDAELIRIFGRCVAAGRMIRMATELRDAGVDLLVRVRLAAHLEIIEGRERQGEGRDGKDT